MALSPENQHRVECEFDSFCKTVVKNHAHDLDRKNKPYRENEVLCAEVANAVTNEPDPFGENRFFAMHLPINIESDALSEAMRTLSERKRLIILLFYFLDMNDREISECLHSVRTTIRDTRTRTLKEMREILENQQKKKKL